MDFYLSKAIHTSTIPAIETSTELFAKSQLINPKETGIMSRSQCNRLNLQLILSFFQIDPPKIHQKQRHFFIGQTDFRSNHLIIYTKDKCTIIRRHSELYFRIISSFHFTVF